MTPVSPRGRATGVLAAILWVAAGTGASAAGGELPFPEPPADAAVFGAMQAEMDRSLKRLRLDDFGPPYFLAYRLTDQESVSVSASFGAETRTDRDSHQLLYVEARFGDPSFDNTARGYHGVSGSGSRDPAVLRQHLWSLTDSAYKAAVAGYLDRKAARATELDRDNLPDFSPEPARRAAIPEPPLDASLARLRDLVSAGSAEFRRRRELHGGHAFASARRRRRYLLTSEGTRIASPAEHLPMTLSLSGWSRAADGMLVESRRSWVARDVAGLPDPAGARTEAAALAAEVESLRVAPVQEPATAPAILDPEFTGVLFHEALGHKLEGTNLRDPSAAQIFRDRVGSRVIPEFLSVVDDPTQEEFQGTPLHGHYLYDDEGVPAARTALVERGVLRAFLMSRWPVKGFDRSNGHGRAEAGRHPSGRMGSLMVVAHAPVSKERLKGRLLELLRAQGRAYGFRLKGSHGGENPSNRASAQTLQVRPRLVFRVDAATGEETLVRGVTVVGTPLVLLNRIAAAGDDAAVGNSFNCRAESGTIPVNQIAPSVLVSEVELQRLPENRARPPLIPSPLHDD